MAPPPAAHAGDVEQGAACGLRARLRRHAREGNAETRLVQIPPHPKALLHKKGPKGNRTSTTKYTWYSFLPKALFEQYRCVCVACVRDRSPPVRRRGGHGAGDARVVEHISGGARSRLTARLSLSLSSPPAPPRHG